MLKSSAILEEAGYNPGTFFICSCTLTPQAFILDMKNKPCRHIRKSYDYKPMARFPKKEAALLDQLKTKEPECRVIAVNKSGEGQTSNTVMMVL